MFMTMMLIMTVMFPFMKHPLSMGMLLIVQTMMVSLISGSMINSFWFSYILFITMLSGALVLFIYMASVASNEKFYTSMKMLSFFIVSIPLCLMSQDSIMKNMIKTKEMNKLIEYQQVNSMMKLFSYQSLSMTMMLVLYLLFTMIVISFIVNIHEGPMRQKS